MRRGQATVELALGVLVIVPMLLIGIYMAEYAQLSLKVQDAATFAVWDGSGSRVQHFNASDNDTPFNATVSSGDPDDGIAERAENIFSGFDPTLDNPPSTVTRALTQGDSLDVKCYRRSFGPSPTQWGQPQPFSDLYHRTGGYSCEASAKLTAVRIPTDFMMRSEGGFFHAPVLERSTMHLCSMGFPTGATCPGRLLVLSNDWGLSGSETNECDTACKTGTYRGMVEHLFAPDLGPAIAFAATYAGNPSLTPFQFSYVSVENNMTQTLGGEGAHEFVTGGANVPGGMVPYARTGRTCFLGKPCP